MKKKLLTLFLVYFCLNLLGTIIDVPDWNNDIYSIQDGIDLCADGDTVLVATGTYYENINFLGKKITVASEFIITGNETVIDSTIIDGNAEDCVVRMDSGEDTLSYLCGFVITNGHKSRGGGIYLYQSGAKLENLKICNNIAEYVYFACGGGIYADGDTYLPGYRQIIIRNTEISDNTATGNTAYGGGFYLSHRLNPVIMENVTITNNHCEGDLQASRGGGSILYTHNARITDCIIDNNSVSAYNDASIGGIKFSDIYEELIIDNCQITNNGVESDWSGGGGIGISTDGNVTISNSLIANNYVQGFSQSGVGGIGVYRGDFLIEDCEIRGNTVDCIGGGDVGSGGLSIGRHCNIIINRTIISDNVGERGAIFASLSDILLINSIICNNQSEVNGGIYKNDIGKFDIVNSIIWDNEAVGIWIDSPVEVKFFHNLIQNGEDEISCTNGGSYFWGESNLDLDPIFIDASNGDYHLQEGSPGIDSGVNICQQWGSLVHYVPEEEIIGKNRDIGIFETGDEDYHFDLPLFLSTEEDISMSLDLEDFMEGMTGTLTGSCENNLESVILDNIISWQPDENWYGFDEVWIEFDTDNREIYSDYILIRVTSVNDAPIIELPEMISFNNIGDYFYNVMQYISDIEQQLISISATGNEHIEVEVQNPDIIFDAEPGWQGTETITVYAEDNFYRLISSDTMQVEVYCHPVADCGENLYGRDGTQVMLDGSLSIDPLLNGLSYQWSTDNGLMIDNADSVLAIANTPEIEEMAEATIYLEVNDGYNSSTDSLNLTYFDDEPQNVECSIFPSSNTIRISWDEPDAAGCGQIELSGYQIYFEGCEFDTLLSADNIDYTFILPEGDYNFGVQAVYSDGTSDVIEVSSTDADEGELILSTGINKIYPNPFNPEVNILFSTTENTEINIYNVKGQLVTKFRIKDEGLRINSVVWDGRDDSGKQVSSGVYFIRLLVGHNVYTEKAVLMK